MRSQQIVAVVVEALDLAPLVRFGSHSDTAPLPNSRLWQHGRVYPGASPTRRQSLRQNPLNLAQFACPPAHLTCSRHRRPDPESPLPGDLAHQSSGDQHVQIALHRCPAGTGFRLGLRGGQHWVGGKGCDQPCGGATG